MNVVPPAVVIDVILGNFQSLPMDPSIAVNHISITHCGGIAQPEQFHYLWNLQLQQFITIGFRHSIFVRYSVDANGQLCEERRVRFPANFPVGWNQHGITANLRIIYNRAADVIVTAYPGC